MKTACRNWWIFSSPPTEWENLESTSKPVQNLSTSHGGFRWFKGTNLG